MSSRSCLVVSLAFSMYMSYANRNSFASFFSIWIPFISCMIAVTRISNIMWNKRGNIGHPCLVPDLRGNAFSFSPLSMILAMDLPYYDFYYVELCSLSAPFLKCFYDK